MQLERTAPSRLPVRQYSTPSFTRCRSEKKWTALLAALSDKTWLCS
jgi:hypothetical protein